MADTYFKPHDESDDPKPPAPSAKNTDPEVTGKDEEVFELPWYNRIPIEAGRGYAKGIVGSAYGLGDLARRVMEPSIVRKGEDWVRSKIPFEDPVRKWSESPTGSVSEGLGKFAGQLSGAGKITGPIGKGVEAGQALLSKYPWASKILGWAGSGAEGAAAGYVTSPEDRHPEAAGHGALAAEASEAAQAILNRLGGHSVTAHIARYILEKGLIASGLHGIGGLPFHPYEFPLLYWGLSGVRGPVAAGSRAAAGALKGAGGTTAGVIGGNLTSAPPAKNDDPIVEDGQ